ncbi:hypothetical protein N0V87_008634 [Didymella glomerata]|uniref:Uncharacterized protein n=1 Tax=Didymella glomerata TaxID=749621 RepID=A0A9W9BWG1_9PLEO|nr:hypothetical protein N0V87_008634 [Didymella glomerata]
MGNLCGKQSKDGLEGPGRTLGSAPAPATKASVPTGANANAPKRTVGGPPRTLGEGNAASNPRSAAAAAAEARANKNSTGDLQKKLDAQKKQTREQTLKEIVNENNRHRDAEATRTAQTHH